MLTSLKKEKSPEPEDPPRCSQFEAGFCPKRQGERSFHCRMALLAHPEVLSVWHEVHGLGILYLSVIAGVMNRKSGA